MRTKQTKRKVYGSMMEIARDFFPALYNEMLQKELSTDPRDVGKRITEEALQEAKRHIQNVAGGNN